MSENKKNKRKRKVLAVSCIFAALIVAGSTFAWFTSKDEVTNRLSASAEYGVAIAENFAPPENWVPGQEINKDVSAVNTGNVDAFVRMYLDGNMRLLQKQTTVNSNARWNTGSVLTDATDVADTNLKGMGLTKLSSDGETYFKTLDKTQTINPHAAASGDKYGYAGEVSGPYSEVQAMQSGRLAYAPANAQYSYVLKEETKLQTYVAKDGAAAVLEDVVIPAGTLVMVVPDDTAKETGKPATIAGGVLSVAKTAPVTVISTSGNTGTYTNVVYVPNNTSATTSLKDVEFESFTPMTNGLYLFLRNESGVNLNSSSNVEFSGYYMQGYNETDYTKANFYALNTNGTASDYAVKGALPAQSGEPAQDVENGKGTGTYANPIEVTLVDGNITKVEPSANLELYNAKYQELAANALKWYTNAAKDKIYAVYNKSEDTEFTADEDIVVEISLGNVKKYVTSGDEEKWTPIGGTTTATFTGINEVDSVYDASNLKFYYNNDLEAGDTSAKLVDQVKLYEGVTNKAYLAFDFDLNVHLDSVQVTFDQDGKELDTAIKAGAGESWKDTAATGGATGARDDGAQEEINFVTWTATAE